MVSGDVFRAPTNALALCVQTGSGVQIITSGFITLFFAALGDLFSPLLFDFPPCSCALFLGPMKNATDGPIFAGDQDFRKTSCTTKPEL